METRYDQLSPVPPLTHVTKILIIISVVAYTIDFFLSSLGFQPHGYSLNEIFGLVPALVKERYWLWQFVTYIFMHGHPLHLLLNMLILWYFGAEIEMRMGRAGFLRFFLVSGIGAGLFNFGVNLLFSDVTRLTHPIIGSSGAIFGILAAYGIFFGNRYFLVFFIFPMKAKYFVLVMAAMELFMGVGANTSDNVAHFAHLGGMLVGAAYIYLIYVRPRSGGGSASRREYEREKLRRQFTLIVNPPNDPSSSEKGGGPYWH
jgi:membrane associated rhomboid family serine protease